MISMGPNATKHDRKINQCGAYYLELESHFKSFDKKCFISYQGIGIDEVLHAVIGKSFQLKANNDELKKQNTTIHFMLKN